MLPRYIEPVRLAELSNQLGYLVMHKITLVFAFWSMAMVSKTLRVPKP